MASLAARRLLHALPDRAQRTLWEAYRSRSGSRRVLPDFIVIGAQKAGTTSLFAYLVENPAIEPALTKEVHYFDGGYSHGERWYRSHFPTRARMRDLRRTHGCAATGEATPYYLAHPLAAERAARLVPDARLVVLLRDPVARAISHHNHFRAVGLEELALADAIDAEPERLRGEVERMLAEPGYESGPLQRYSYLTRGHYAEQLERWFASFPREQFLIEASTRLFSLPDEVVEATCEFIGVRPHRLPTFGAHNARDYDDADPAVLDRLRAYFEPHNQRLYELLGVDFGW